MIGVDLRNRSPPRGRDCRRIGIGRNAKDITGIRQIGSSQLRPGREPPPRSPDSDAGGGEQLAGFDQPQHDYCRSRDDSEATKVGQQRPFLVQPPRESGDQEHGEDHAAALAADATSGKLSAVTIALNSARAATWLRLKSSSASTSSKVRPRGKSSR